VAIGAFIPLAIFMVILGSVGFRLVRLWQRTGELPELSLGAGLLIVSCSMPLCAAGRIPGLAMEMTGRACFALGMVAVWVGMSLMVFFTYWVFRRGSSWGRVLLATLAVGLGCGVVYMSIQNFAGDSIEAIKPMMLPGTLTVMGTILMCFFWGGTESFRYWRALSRQQALGLADPVVTNRFLLWGIASVTSSALILVIAGCAISGMTIMREPVPLAMLAGAGCIMSATWYLTFFAPERYLGWVRARVQNS
jgi:hypothetical protein